MYNTEKVKPVSSIKDAHASGWVSALGGIYNTDMVVSGAMDDQLHFHRVNLDQRTIEKAFSIRCVILIVN